MFIKPNRELDRLAQTRILLAGLQLPAFQLCGYTGLLLAFVQSALLVRHLHLSQLVLLGMTTVVVVTFFSLVMATKIITGEEQIIYYHHEIAVLTMLALFLRARHQPLLPYLDVASIGIGLFLACGRIGCLLVGCCHGRPCDWGVCYTKEHAAAGFPSYLVGVRLFPIQLVESVFVFGVVMMGIAMVLRGYPPGTALVLYVVAYGIGRFWLEFARGDVARPYLWGFSQAQWISLLLAVAVVAAGSARVVPVAGWHSAAAATLVVSLIVVSIWRRLDRSHKFELLHPQHIQEIVGAVQLVKLASQHELLRTEGVGTGPVIHVAETSRGYRISAGHVGTGDSAVEHYSVSIGNGELSLKAGQVLSRLIARVERRNGVPRLVRGDAGILHIIFRLAGDDA